MHLCGLGARAARAPLTHTPQAWIGAGRAPHLCLVTGILQAFVLGFLWSQRVTC